MTATDVDKHMATPPPDEPPYFTRCRFCGQKWPCPTVIERIRATAAALLADVGQRNPQRMLDISEVVPGCWVSWRGADATDSGTESRGGVVIRVAHYGDPETGESRRNFEVARNWRGIKWDRLTQDQVGAIDPPDQHIIARLRRAMCAEVGRCSGSVLPAELRLLEAITILTRSDK